MALLRPGTPNVGYQMIDIGIAQESDLPQIEELYAAAGYGGGVNDNDKIIVACIGSQVVGVVRLCPEEGVTVLRGMQIAHALQRKGIGAGLLRACAGYLDGATSYCLPYSHLTQFYGAASFEVIGAEDIPRFLAARLSSYLSRGQDVVAMRREVPTNYSSGRLRRG